MNFLLRQIRFVSSFKGKVLVGSILGLFLASLIVFLEPFDTNEFRSTYRTLLLSGFGIIFTCTYILYSVFENMIYNRMRKLWLVWHELLSILIFLFVSGTFIYLYNHLIINGSSYSVRAHWWYLSHIVAAMIPIVTPILLFFRQKFGQLVLPVSPESIVLTGLNNEENLELLRNELLYVQAVENYVEIIYIDSKKNKFSKTFRQTLMNIHQQAPFLEKCHRSYLVNLDRIEEIQGNSQRARVLIQYIEEEIPLSKTYYKNIKSRIN